MQVGEGKSKNNCELYERQNKNEGEKYTVRSSILKKKSSRIMSTMNEKNRTLHPIDTKILLDLEKCNVNTLARF